MASPMIRKIPTSNMSKEDWEKLRSTTIGGSERRYGLGQTLRIMWHTDSSRPPGKRSGG